MLTSRSQLNKEVHQHSQKEFDSQEQEGDNS